MRLTERLSDGPHNLALSAAIVFGAMLVAMGQGSQELARLRPLGGLIVLGSILLVLTSWAGDPQLA